MKFDIEKLDAKGRQELFDNLHATGIVPTVLHGTGSPAHIAMLGSQINDLRQVVSIQSNNVTRLFDLLTRQGEVSDKQAALIDRILNQPGLASMLPGERDH